MRRLVFVARRGMARQPLHQVRLSYVLLAEPVGDVTVDRVAGQGFAQRPVAVAHPVEQLGVVDDVDVDVLGVVVALVAQLLQVRVVSH